MESKHCVRVLRLKKGATIALVDGKGRLCMAEITVANPKRCVVAIKATQSEYKKRDYYLHIAIAPTKNIARFEWFLEKATEIGIDEITPLLCHRSERRTIKPERLNKILIAAMKQSLKAYLPRLNPMQKLVNFVQATSSNGYHEENKAQRFIAFCEEEHINSPLIKGARGILKSKYKKGSDVIILIGPEGDFTREEIKKALENDFQPVRLGESRLRTETAGIVACHTIHTIEILNVK